MIVAAIQCLEGPAKTWFEGLLAIRTWADFSEDIEEKFGDIMSAADSIISLQKKKKRANETPRKFIAEGLTDDGKVIRELRSTNNFRSLREKNVNLGRN